MPVFLTRIDMWDHRYISRIDFRTIPILFVLMFISILVIAATTGEQSDFAEETLFTPMAKSQMRWFAIGWAAYLFCRPGLPQAQRVDLVFICGHARHADRFVLCALHSKCAQVVQDPRS